MIWASMAASRGSAGVLVGILSSASADRDIRRRARQRLAASRGSASPPQRLADGGIAFRYGPAARQDRPGRGAHRPPLAFQQAAAHDDAEGRLSPPGLDADGGARVTPRCR